MKDCVGADATGGGGVVCADAALRLVLMSALDGFRRGRWSCVRERQRPKRGVQRGAAGIGPSRVARRWSRSSLRSRSSFSFSPPRRRPRSRRPPSPAPMTQRSPPSSRRSSATRPSSARTSTITARLASMRRSAIAAINVRSAASPLRPWLSYLPTFRRCRNVSKATRMGFARRPARTFFPPIEPSQIARERRPSLSDESSAAPS